MKKAIYYPVCLFLLWLIPAGRLHSQDPQLPSRGDTASYPYWIGMMQDPSVNFFKVQRAFNLYWQDRPITRSCGWKVFKRWEYMMQGRVSPTGERPAPDAVLKAWEEYQATNPTLSGSWTSFGPATIPYPGPAGYEGLGRLNVVAYHPTDANKLYVGAPSGGLWQSNNAGATWKIGRAHV